MMYDIASTTRRCARTGRDLKPGERHMVVLYDRDEKLVREDVCMESWQTPSDDAFAWWQCKAPAADAASRLIIDDGLVYDCFTRLEGQNEPQKVNFRYVLALWLLRKRRLKFEEVQKQSGNDWLILREPKVKKMHRVLDPHLNEEAIAVAQQEVETMLRAA